MKTEVREVNLTGPSPHGRGAGFNPANRFEKQRFELAEWEGIDELPEENPRTQYIPTNAKTLVNKVESPDIGPAWSMNPYQGCEHGCIYCYARNTHEYWGYSAGVDFEQKILYKPDAPRLLAEAFNKKGYKPEPIMLSGNTDCYQPLERKLKLTRQLLEVCLRYRHPVGIITKNALVLRDLDILVPLAELQLVHVYHSITTLDESLRRILEPRTSTTKARLKSLETLAKARVPVGAMFAPMIPGLNDHELPELMKQAAEAGIQAAGYTIVRLNGAIGPLFEDWVERHLPNQSEKILRRIKAAHGGQLNDSRFGTRMRGEGEPAEVLGKLFRAAQTKYLAERSMPKYDYSHFIPQKGRQCELF
jgi:DNA repair photolyase